MPGATFIATRLNDLSADVLVTSVATGDILVKTSGKWQNLAVGATNSVFVSTGTAALPSWTDELTLTAVTSDTVETPEVGILTAAGTGINPSDLVIQGQSTVSGNNFQGGDIILAPGRSNPDTGSLNSGNIIFDLVDGDGNVSECSLDGSGVFTCFAVHIENHFTGRQARLIFSNPHGLRFMDPTGSHSILMVHDTIQLSITGDQNNWTPSVVYPSYSLTANGGPITITGYAIQDQIGSVQAGTRVRFWNGGANAITFANESLSSTAANRFVTTSGSDIVLSANEGMEIERGQNTRWRAWKL